jgi:hypothetical protein
MLEGQVLTMKIGESMVYFREMRLLLPTRRIFASLHERNWPLLFQDAATLRMINRRHRPDLSAVEDGGNLILIRVLFLLTLCILVLAPVGVKANSDLLPRVEDIIEKSIGAMGGREAFETIQNKITTMTGTRKGKAVRSTVYQERPNYYHAIVDSEEGRMESGSDGHNVWEFSKKKGVVIKTGKERADRLIGYAFDGLISWKTHYRSVQTIAVENITGKPCYRILATPFEGTARTVYFEADTHLPVKIVMDVNILGPLWKSRVETFLGDYRKVDCLLIPHQSRVTVSGKEVFTGIVESIRTNVSSKERFDLPPDIREILQKK